MTNIRQSRLGVLCYRLSPPTVSIIEKMAQAVPEFPLKAYPIYGPRPAQVVNFPFRPSEKTPKTFFFNNIRGSAPENQIRALGLNLAVELVRQSDVICLIGLQGIPALIAVVLGRMKHKPVLVLSQTMNSLAEVNRPAILRILKGIMLRLSTYHVAQTPITLDTLVRNYRIPTEKITLIPWDGGAGAFYDSIIKSGSC